jgi:cystathionine gamma-synthase
MDKICINGLQQQESNPDFPSERLRPSEGPEECAQFVEERFGRNLDTSLVSNAKLAIRRRIAGSLSADAIVTEAIAPRDRNNPARGIEQVSVDNVYLHPSGMSSIFNTHRVLLEARGSLRSICFG